MTEDTNQPAPKPTKPSKPSKKRKRKGKAKSTGNENNRPARSAGRPPGSKTVKAIGEKIDSRCPKCNSTKRTPYGNVRRIATAGTHPQFGDYKAIVFRTTRCRDCAQARTVRDVWDDSKTNDNHFVDGVVHCAVLASLEGANYAIQKEK